MSFSSARRIYFSPNVVLDHRFAYLIMCMKGKEGSWVKNHGLNLVSLLSDRKPKKKDALPLGQPEREKARKQERTTKCFFI